MQQLRSMYRTLLSTSGVADEEKLRLDPSFFSRPPDIATYPIILTSNTTHPEGPTTCELKTKPIHRWSMARIIVFQKNGNKHLQTLLLHYLHVLPPDAIAVIDHDSTDSMTMSLLSMYGDLGVHVWHCSGPFDWKWLMWSMVTHAYANFSEFVFPVDVDELIAVTGDPFGDADVPFSWNANSFYRALTFMNETGRTAKMETLIPLPHDCHFLPRDSNNSVRSNVSFFPSPVCSFQHAIRRPLEARWGCMDKSFSRGRDFVQTDTGNHFLVTHWTTKQFAQYRKIRRREQYNVVGMCHAMGVDAWFDTSPLGLVHVQTMELADWLVHAFRGAAVRNLTRGVNCSETRGGSSHYCLLWHQIQTTGMHTDRLVDLYRGTNCPPWESNNVKPLGDFFSHACCR